ncbi:TonB-dependent receptor domain-containing protein [Pedobacter fastidiosus]|uniref:TonB-dependent receptor n=1 Tax=Pedobacter fastidiosus TaxID=2765361 RepID=A0ABR7KT98_9SPHI|nr:TonB-dependent receptor [Pedobacter fastidiosus]MBC6111208.1 TonB-dependent receptor [Pedobacter fastidiosus]
MDLLNTIKRVALTVLTLSISIYSYAQTGKISGKITDKTTGQTLVGLSVLIEGTSIGTTSDAEGNYTLNTVKAGTYKVVYSFISFKKQTIPNVKVTAGKVTTVDVVMEDDQSTLNDVVVSGKRLTGTEASLLGELKKSQSIANGVSSQTIQRSGDSDAAQVVKRVPGITIVDNRFINIRGLSERYSSVLLNNVVAPSLETDVRSFSFDLIPSNQIDRVLVYKSPSADLPADFAGGVVKVFLKSVPDEDKLTIDYGVNYRENASFKDFKRPSSGDLYFTGFNSGDNDLAVNFPSTLKGITDSRLNAAGHSFNNNWQPVTNIANVDQKLNIYGSKRFNINNKLLGNITAISYSNSKTHNAVFRGNYDKYDPVSQSAREVYNYNDDQYNYNVRLGIVHNWAFKLDNNNTFEFKNLYNQLSTSQYINRIGSEDQANYSNYASSVLYRGIYSGQLTGTHKFNNENTKFDWVLGYSKSYRDQPDYKRYRTDATGNGAYSLFVPIGGAQPEFLGRFYSRMDENAKTGAFNVEQNLNPKSETFKPSVKVGGYYEDKQRTFNSRNIGYVRANSSLFDTNLLNGTIDQLFQWENINLTNGIKLDEKSKPSDNYDASNRLFAGYANFILPYKDKLTLVAGVRVENNLQKLNSADDVGPINLANDITRVLPSANLSYNISEKSLFRLAYGKTLNRPEFRELAPFTFYDFDLNLTNTGNQGLQTAKIDNYDLKYEFYPTTSELISVSTFYKYFTNAIETTIVPGTGAKSFSFQNAESVKNLGVELELRKTLAGLTGSKFLNDLTLLINASYINSKVKLRDNTTGQSDNRPMQGQSPYIVNAAVFYNNVKSKIQVNLLYNVAGKRIAYVGTVDVPDIYEMPKSVIDLVITKTFSNKISLKANFNDLLNQNTTLLQDGNGDGNFDRNTDQIFSQFKSGRQIGLTLSYKLF